MAEELSSKAQARCLIVSSNQVVTPYPVFPLGAAYVVAALNRHGHSARHFDLLGDGGMAGFVELLQEQQFDLVGVSIRNLDTVDSASPDEYLDGVVELVGLIRQTLNTRIVLGGPAFSIMPERLMELLEADYGVVGEGEEVMVWLATEIAAGRFPQEKILKAPRLESFATRAEPGIATAQYYTNHGGMLNLQSKRGCPYNCSYCSYPTIEGRKIRYRDPEEVVDEMARLNRDHGAKYLFFADSVFNDPAGKYLEIAETLIRREISIPWCAFFRPENISREDLRLLKRAGLAAVELGTDGATDTTLAGFGKGFSYGDVLKVHENVIAEEIPCAHFIMFGGPGETRATVDEGLKHIEKLDKSVVFAFIGIRILPGTAICDRAIAEGVVAADQSLLKPVFYYSPEVTRQEIETKIMASFASRMDRIYPCHQFYDRIAMLHKIGKVGPLWELLI
ncbi:lipid biosynthesis B12-binding/radical SAM protein [Desulfosediminicola sp.]|uniref:lipid biosynthesis B12-binding/radical SAM protein n=1 Tax=Desulfosediminicola sp. TaxID=2886825 RepID=UPI003AF22472